MVKFNLCVPQFTLFNGGIIVHSCLSGMLKRVINVINDCEVHRQYDIRIMLILYIDVKK